MSKLAQRFAALVYRNKNFTLNKDGKLVYPYKDKLVAVSIAKFLKNTFDDKSADAYHEMFHTDITYNLVDGEKIFEVYQDLYRNYNVRSCMVNSAWEKKYYSLYINNPDSFKLAYYIEGNQAARAIIYCADDKKQYFSKLYGELHTRLRFALMHNGIKPLNYKKQLSISVKPFTINESPYLDAFVFTNTERTKLYLKQENGLKYYTAQ